jgi:hypothetical protein
MSVAVRWSNLEKTIVVYDIEGRWTWDEFYPAYNEAIAMELSVTHRVDVIVDLHHANLLPDNVLTHIKNISDKQPPNIGITVIVTKNRFVLTMYQIGTKFYGKIGHYFRVAATTDEAYAMIQSTRQEA